MLFIEEDPFVKKPDQSSRSEPNAKPMEEENGLDDNKKLVCIVFTNYCYCLLFIVVVVIVYCCCCCCYCCCYCCCCYCYCCCYCCCCYCCCCRLLKRKRKAMLHTRRKILKQLYLIMTKPLKLILRTLRSLQIKQVCQWWHPMDSNCNIILPVMLSLYSCIF